MPESSQPPYLFPPYASSRKRAPTRPLVALASALMDVSGPVFGHETVRETDADLTAEPGGAAIGERIIVSGVVKDEDARPVRNALIEVWQANAAGRYRHRNDQHDAPARSQTSRAVVAFSPTATGGIVLVTIKPGAYPWRNHHNAWRPAHIHFSIFGAGLVSRLVTAEMYFPGDPLLPHDPIFGSIPDERARNRLISSFDWASTIPEQALGFRLDIVLRGHSATPMER